MRLRPGSPGNHPGKECTIPRSDPEAHDYTRDPDAGERGSFRPLVFGEALFDHFPDGSRVLGGAPFNVAWHLRGLKADPLLISRIGTDLEGTEILARAGGWGMDHQGIQVHGSRPTGHVEVETEGGEPRFTIEAGQAWDEIEVRQLPPTPQLAEIHLLYHGTLALRAETSRGTLALLRDTLRCPVLVDVNLRDPWWTREEVAWALPGAACAKMNREEAALLSGLPVDSREELVAAARHLRGVHGADMIVLTLGEDGALAVDASETVWQEAPEVDDLRDTVGAGDAFSAVLALGIHRGWSLAQILQRATDFAADLCEVRGAIPGDSSLYARHVTRWDDER